MNLLNTKRSFSSKSLTFEQCQADAQKFLAEIEKQIPSFTNERLDQELQAIAFNMGEFISCGELEFPEVKETMIFAVLKTGYSESLAEHLIVKGLGSGIQSFMKKLTNEADRLAKECYRINTENAQKELELRELQIENQKLESKCNSLHGKN